MKLLALTGFLGSGKTTLLLRVAQYLCAQNRKVAIIENEVGKIGVDNQFLELHGLNVRTVFGGCVCCTLHGTLHETLTRIYDQINPDWVIVEPSGVASPQAIYDTFSRGNPFLQEIFLIVLVDPMRLKMMQTLMAPFLEESLKAADLILINKIDLQSTEQLREIRRQILSIQDDATVLEISSTIGTNFDCFLNLLNTPHPIRQTIVSSGRVPHHSTQTRVVSCQRNLKASITVAPGKHLDQIAQFLCDLSLALQRHGCTMIGHIKAILKINGEYVLFRLTQFGQIPDRDGNVTHPFDQVHIDFTVLACGIDEKEFLECVEQSFQQLTLK